MAKQFPGWTGAAFPPEQLGGAPALRSRVDDRRSSPPRRDTPENRVRLVGIDAVRYLAAAAIVMLHSTGGGSPAINFRDFVDPFCRFAVPFFFVVSGYLAARRDEAFVAGTRRILGRILPPFVAWLVIYHAVGAVRGDPRATDIHTASDLLNVAITGGLAFHLWFLPSLGLSLILLLAMRPIGIGWVLLAATGLYAVGLALGPYSAAFDLPRLDTRNGPFFGLLLVAAGHGLGRLRSRPPLWVGIASTLTGLAAHHAELLLIYRQGWGPYSNVDLLCGTAAFGVGVFIIALNLPEGSWVRRLADLGRLSLGIYCVHVLFIWALRGVIGAGDLFGVLLLAAAVLAASTIVSIVLTKAPILRRLVI